VDSWAAYRPGPDQQLGDGPTISIAPANSGGGACTLPQCRDSAITRLVGALLLESDEWLPPMPDTELVEAIRALLAESAFRGEGYRKIWARLRFKGIRTSKRRVLRLTRAHGLQVPHRAGRPRGPRHDPHRARRRDVGHGSALDVGARRRKSAARSPTRLFRD
jgi:hypothetical protein